VAFKFNVFFLHKQTELVFKFVVLHLKELWEQYLQIHNNMTNVALVNIDNTLHIEKWLSLIGGVDDSRQMAGNRGEWRTSCIMIAFKPKKKLRVLIILLIHVTTISTFF